ncbi:MAG: hypothetical protein FJZ43_03435 [Candidatus Staskawiczbacteria bacterium]|nr:hypothetical protein [Candidatus Staskawiczbacteria bacterium]
MNKKLIIASTITTLLALPLTMLAFSAGNQPTQQTNLDINALIQIVLDIIWPVAIAFFIVMFIIAGFQFASARGNPEGVASARNFVIFGVVGVAVAVLAFSLPFVVKNLVE